MSYGKVQVGGPFEMIECKSGRVVTDKDFHGKFMLIYFGFTHCPDICPDELEKLSSAIAKVDSVSLSDDGTIATSKDKETVGSMVTPVFLSIDPGRDTPEVVTEYLKDFSPRFVGLTGTDEQVQKAAKAYRIYISRGEAYGGDANDYLVDHSIFFFLMSPTGEFVDYFGRNATADDVAVKLVQHVKEYSLDKQAGRI